jgi:tRNA(fMet)-specific endonuclease VapC
MPRYMLDADMCGDIMKRSNQTVIKRLHAVPIADVCISVIAKSELLYVVEVSPRQEAKCQCTAGGPSALEVLEFRDAPMPHYAEIRADLKTRGQTIGADDVFFGAHACTLRLRLVANNAAELGHVKGLTLENWTLIVRRTRLRGEP